ncbi:DUF397 domain-containing protein [Streptomyces sp. H27-D2]|uniref:DUF397 domain-containing protein n=1 Tax=Streptomyces sp. H27-D2 TaxID=3046304 RepID=UPI002DBB001E|nr:DUF397 domain-containing protein [Streptomyces sp. H27-D2]MEC4020661.1 DUF397 domain-containing protein [Streptomyces sp. H27-D2]
MTMYVPNAETLRAQWVTSSYSGGGNDCVQAAALDGGRLAVRDSKDPAGPALLFTPHAWQTFVASARGGEFSAG